MIETATAINTLPYAARQAGFESPSEQLITLTYAQLQDLIKRAIEQAVQPLQDEIAQLRDDIGAMRSKITALERLQEQDITRVYQEVAYDRQRIAKLEHPPQKAPGKTVLTRAEKLEKYLASRPDHKANFETLRGHLGVNKARLNEAIKTLMDLSPGRYAIARAPSDKRKRILVMLPK